MYSTSDDNCKSTRGQHVSILTGTFDGMMRGMPCRPRLPLSYTTERVLVFSGAVSRYHSPFPVRQKLETENHDGCVEVWLWSHVLKFNLEMGLYWNQPPHNEVRVSFQGSANHLYCVTGFRRRVFTPVTSNSNNRHFQMIAFLMDRW